MGKSRTLIHITLFLCFLALVLAIVDFGVLLKLSRKLDSARPAK